MHSILPVFVCFPYLVCVPGTSSIKTIRHAGIRFPKRFSCTILVFMYILLLLPTLGPPAVPVGCHISVFVCVCVCVNVVYGAPVLPTCQFVAFVFHDPDVFDHCSAAWLIQAYRRLDISLCTHIYMYTYSCKYIYT